MLALTRKDNEYIVIKPFNDIDPDMTVGELFTDGGIEILINKTSNKEVRIGFAAPDELNIVRGELLKK